MRRTSVVRFLSSLVIASFVFAGPLAPLAQAQQPVAAVETAQSQPAPAVDTAQGQPVPAVETAQAQPAPVAQVQLAPPPAVQPMPPAQPAAPAVRASQPDLFQETLKAQRGSDRSQSTYRAEAAVANVFLVPGRAITCAAGVIVGLGVLALSFGSAYRMAGGAFDEGCGGKWIVSGDDMRPDTPPSMIVTDPGR
jgi:hypothetical protein